ncbi:MAG TPA: radical SAM protein [Candidatus Coprousia avicola]|nr:radical SAM protein [Candidatus Coprousia avicola]
MDTQHVSNISAPAPALDAAELDATYKSIEGFFSPLSESQAALLCTHLAQRRREEAIGRPVLHVVFDLLPQCNLACRGCGINAIAIVGKTTVSDAPLSTQKILAILDAIAGEAQRRTMDVKLDLGGGEPLLRPDIERIVRHAAELFGPQGVGIDTNAALPQAASVLKALLPHLSYLGVSLNGPRSYHNWWAGASEGDPFESAYAVVRELCESDEDARIVEVTSVATSMNCDDLPVLMERLAGVGVQRYSVHRAVRAGRMRAHGELLPSLEQYFKLLVELLEVSERTSQRVHVHHSIERMFAALLTILADGGRRSKTPAALARMWRAACAGMPSGAQRSVTVGITPEGVLAGGAWQTDGCPVLSEPVFRQGASFASQLDEIILRNAAAAHAACDGSEARCPLIERRHCTCCEVLCPVMRSMKRG